PFSRAPCGAMSSNGASFKRLLNVLGQGSLRDQCCVQCQVPRSSGTPSKGTVMRTLRVCALVGAAVSAAILSASFAPTHAADLGYGSIKDIPPPPPSGRAWYLKGTIGMKNPEPGSIWIDEPSFVDHTVH